MPRAIAVGAMGGLHQALPVTNLVAVNDAIPGQVDITWTNPDPSTYDAWLLYQSIDGGAYSLIAQSGVSGRVKNDSSVLNYYSGESYDMLYKMVTTKVGNTDSPNVITSPALRTPPGLPSLTTATASNPGTITIDCTAAPGTKTSGYDVALSVNDGSSWAATVDTGADPDHVFTGIANASTCKIRVRTRDSLGQSSAWVTSGSIVVPNDVAGPTATTPTTAWSGTGVNVTFATCTDALYSVVSLVIEVNYGGSGWVGTGYSQANGTGTTTNITTPDANRGQTAQFRLKTTDTYGNVTTGSASTIMTTKPKGTFGILPDNSNYYFPSGPAAWQTGPPNVMMAGDWADGRGARTALYFYGTKFADTAKGYAPDSGKIFIQRYGAWGSSGTNNVVGHNYGTQPGGAPTMDTANLSTIYLSGSDAYGDCNFNAAQLTAIGNGSYKGIGSTDPGGPRAWVPQGGGAFGLGGYVTLVFN